MLHDITFSVKKIRFLKKTKLFGCSRALLKAGLYWPHIFQHGAPFRKSFSHEGNTEEENNAYVVFKSSIQDQLGKRVVVMATTT